MKYLLRISLLTCLLTSVIYGQTTRVLFIGNSYTYVNDLPGMLYNIALSMGDTVIYDSNTPGGYTLQMHAGNITTQQLIGQPDWDYVVLQAQSQEPSFSPAQVATYTYPYAALLDSMVHAANSCAITMFYMTWGRKYGDASNCLAYPPVCTYEGMSGRLRASYLEMGADNFGRVAPVGMAWMNSREQDSTINLWSGDNSHPSLAGTYLTACVFYASIFKQSPVGSTYYAGLSSSDAIFLQNIAEQTVFDSLDTWLLNQNPINASYSYSTTGLDVQFNNLSFNATGFQWDFGDGQFSSSADPLHQYLMNGVYDVKLIVTNNCFSDTLVQQVTVASMGVENNEYPGGVILYPNPSNGMVYFQGNGSIPESATIFSANGTFTKNVAVENESIDLQKFPNGIYWVKLGNTVRKITIIH